MASDEQTRATPNPYVHRIHDYPGRIFCVQTGETGEAELRALVRRERPKLVEIGSGSGQHLIGLAERFPEADCIGLELRYKRTVRTIEKAAKRGIENVYVAHLDARRIEETFPAASITELHVHFPDPWAKKRQAKHRILTEWLLETAGRLLVPGGVLEVKTDYETQFDRFRELFCGAPYLQIEWQTRDLDRSPHAAMNIPTEFENLFRHQGLPIFALRAVREGGVSAPPREAGGDLPFSEGEGQ